MKKLLFILSFLSITFSPSSVLADGFLFRPGQDNSEPIFLNESNQQAYINHINGRETLTIAIDIDKSAGDSVWIFPVPADPSTVKIDILTELPNYQGLEISQAANNLFGRSRNLLLSTQIYPWLIFALTDAFFGVDIMSLSSKLIVYDHLDKEGITTEIISAQNPLELYDYLASKGLNIPSESIPVLGNYSNKNYSFIVSWLNFANYKNSDIPGGLKGVSVNFPTENIYFPMLLTSVYKETKIPITLRIDGLSSPILSKELESYTKTEYLKNDYSNTPYPYYTKVDINAPSNLFTEDLWFSNSIPAKSAYHISLINNYFPIIFGLLTLNSIIASVWSGLLVFQQFRSLRGILKLGLLGLSNCFTLIAFIITCRFFPIKQETGRFRCRKVFVPVFSLTFVLLTFLSTLLLQLIL